LARVAELAPRFVQAVKLSGATYLSEQFEQFEPEGVTGVVVVAESHFSIHTWPEHGLAVIDVLTCSEQVDIDTFVLSLAEFCKPKDVKRESINRVSIENS
jgi:S-adenosylmethionine decarboxylase